MDKIWEIAKEAIRVIVLAVVSWLLTVGVLDNVITAFFGTKIDPTQTILISGFITSILRGIEKQLHENDSRMQLPF